MGDEMESNLEMRCSADEAWYDGTLCVSPESKDLILVHFNDFGEDDDETFHKNDLRNPGKLRSRVRVRSVQLQDSQCRTVYEGQKICGCLDDGEDRKYYDAEVVLITKKKHSFKDDGEECLCKFTVFWLDGPKKKENTVIGCADVCFLSSDAPEDDPMVKNLLNTLASNGDQPRRKSVKSGPLKSGVPKSVPSPRPRTPSPSLELAPSKKQPSREPSPAVALPNQKVPQQQLARRKSPPMGSKKKRIMQAEEKLIARDKGKPGMDHGISAPEGDEEAAGHGSKSDGAEQRDVSGGGKAGKKGSVQAGEKNRRVKGKAQVGTPQVINREETAAGNQDIMKDNIPSRTFKQRLKLNTKRMATPDKAPVRQDIVTESLAERVKLKKTAKMAPPSDPAPAPAVRDEAIKPDNMQPVVQSLGERVKLKTAQKSPAVSPLEAHKDSLQIIGKQIVRKQTIKRKLIQLRDPSPDPLMSKFDKVVKPTKTSSKPTEIAPKPTNVEPDQPKMQKRKAGRPRKHPPPEPPAPATDSPIAKTVELPNMQNQSPQQEETVDANPDENPLPDPVNKTTKKRQRDEERSHHDNDDIVSSQEEEEKETLDAYVRKQANGDKKKKLVIQDDDILSEKSAGKHEEDHNLPPIDEANEMSCHMENISIPDKLRDIENKYRNGNNFSTPQAALELISLAASNHYRDEGLDHHFRVSSPQENSGSLNLDDDETGVSEKRRRVVGKRQFVITDDEADDVPDVPSKAHEFDDQCSPNSSDPRNPCSALDEEVVVPNAGVAGTRLLLLENMEPDASALDAMQLLQRHTEGVCAVHVLPVLEFQVSATGYALYCDSAAAVKALQWLTAIGRFVVSLKGRPWIVSQAKEVYGPQLYGIVVHTAYKSDDPSMCGIISDQAHVHDLIVVTKQDNSAYFQAQQMSKTYEEHKKWRKELYERIIQHEKKS